MSDRPVDAPTDAARLPVRPARDEDLPRLLAIQTAAFPEADRELLRRGVRAGLALVTIEGAGAATAGDTGVAVAAPVGYVLSTVDEQSVYIAELAVAPGHRRRGHGRRLLAAVAARNAGRERLQLTTRIDNEAARSFYASLGFREERMLPDYYGDGATERDGENGGDGTADGDGATDGVLLVRDLE